VLPTLPPISCTKQKANIKKGGKKLLQRIRILDEYLDLCKPGPNKFHSFDAEFLDLMASMHQAHNDIDERGAWISIAEIC